MIMVTYGGTVSGCHNGRDETSGYVECVRVE